MPPNELPIKAKSPFAMAIDEFHTGQRCNPRGYGHAESVALPDLELQIGLPGFDLGVQKRKLTYTSNAIHITDHDVHWTTLKSTHESIVKFEGIFSDAEYGIARVVDDYT